MSHTETVRRSFMFDAADEDELDATLDRIVELMRDAGLRNIHLEVTHFSTRDYEVIATGEQDG